MGRETGDSRAHARRSGCRPLRPSPAPGRRGSERRSQSGSWVPVPHKRKLDARPVAVLRRRSARPSASSGGQPIEHRAAQPLVEESVDVARGLELVGQRLVGQAPAFAFGRVLDAAGGADEDHPAHGQIGPRHHVKRNPCPQRVAQQVARFVADGGCGQTAPRGRRSPEGRPARRRTLRGRAGPPPPACASAPGASPKRPNSRPVWVKPWSTTSGGPDPRTSTWSGTPGERTGHLQRDPGRRVGSARGHRRGDLSRARGRRRWRSPWRSASGPTSGSTSAAPPSSPSGWRWRPEGRRSSA